MEEGRVSGSRNNCMRVQERLAHLNKPDEDCPQCLASLIQNIYSSLFNSYRDAEDTIETKTNLSANSDNQLLSGLHGRVGVWGIPERVLCLL